MNRYFLTADVFTGHSDKKTYSTLATNATRASNKVSKYIEIHQHYEKDNFTLKIRQSDENAQYNVT